MFSKRKFGGKITFKAARVKEVIHDIYSLNAKHVGGPQGHAAVGTIRYELIDDDQGANVDLFAKPLNTTLKNIPLLGEIVIILFTTSSKIYKSKSSTQAYYLTTVNIWGNQSHNALPEESANASQNETTTTEGYEEASSGITQKDSTPPGENLMLKLGEYFKETPYVKPLFPYEGDVLLEGRFGNSIRFGSTTHVNGRPNLWSQTAKSPAEIGSPITIISNGLPVHSPQKNLIEINQLYEKGASGVVDDASNKSWVHTLENINDDPSSIYLTSNQGLYDFKPAGVGNPSMIAEIKEEKTLKESLQEFTNYIYSPKTTKQTLPTNVEEDVNLYKPITPELSNIIESRLKDIEEDTLQTPYYMIEGETDTNSIQKSNTFESLMVNNATQPTDSTPELSLSQSIGAHFKLIHLIDSPKSSDLNYSFTSNNHPEAVFERNNVGFYISSSASGVKDIITKEFIDNEYRVLTDTLQASPINNVEPYKYSKTDTELIREAEANLFGNYSSYGINNYPGIDPSIKQEFIINNLKILFEECIDHIVESFPSIRIISAYRSKALNNILNENPTNSEHIYGYAVDIRDNTNGNNLGLYNWCVQNLEFKNLMWAYPERKEKAWIHISYIEGQNHKMTTLASENEDFHKLYGGKRRGRNNNYQDNIKIAKVPPLF